MRALLVGLAFLGLCARATAEPAQVPGDAVHPVIGDANAPWRQRAGAAAADHVAARACLARGDNCETLFQTPCLNAYDEEERSPAVARRCDWHAITVWEDEIIAILEDLRAKLGGNDLHQLNDSETAWETSMLADVGL